MLKSVCTGINQPIEELVSLAVTRQHDEADRQRALSFLSVRAGEITAVNAQKMMSLVPRINPRGPERIICHVLSQCGHLPEIQQQAVSILSMNRRQRCLLPRGD